MNTLTEALDDYVEALTDQVVDGRVFRAADPDDPFPSTDPNLAVRDAIEGAVRRHLARLPERYRAASLSGLDPERQHAAELTAWVQTSGARTLLLGGEPGVGKTWGAAAVATGFAARYWRHVGLRQTPVLWCNIAGLLDDLRKQTSEAEVLWDRVKAVPLLVLDDLAHVRPTDWAAERVWMLTNARTESSNARTVVTTNATGRQLAEAWGAATMDRLYGDALGLVVTGPSRRRPLPGRLA